MRDLKQFDIPFVGLKDESHLFEYKIDNKFFESFRFDDFLDANIKIVLNFEKKSTFFELNFKAKGFVNVPCDTTGMPFDQKINTTLPLLVKFGHEFNDENEEVLMLPHGAFEMNVAQYIYEMIVLAVPSKRVHPKVLDGTMESEALKRLKELEITKEKPAENADPRWDKLKELLTAKNT